MKLASGERSRGESGLNGLESPSEIHLAANQGTKQQKLLKQKHQRRLIYIQVKHTILHPNHTKFIYTDHNILLHWLTLIAKPFIYLYIIYIYCIQKWIYVQAWKGKCDVSCELMSLTCHFYSAFFKVLKDKKTNPQDTCSKFLLWC